jgi:two-component system, OmpR family, response regulator
MPYRPLKQILLVEDDPDIQEVAALALTALGGYAVEVCGTAVDALARAPALRPDLILMDVMMPGTDGVGALTALRQLEATASTPVVFMTANVGRQDVSRYQDMGCLGVIPKPFDPTFLPAALEGMWRRHISAALEVHQREFDMLSQTYMEELSDKVRALQAAAKALSRQGWDRPTVESLYRLAHRMAGSSGVYGLSSLSRAAGILEDRVKRLLDDPSWPPAVSPGELTTVVKGVRQAARTDVRVARQRRNAT